MEAVIDAVAFEDIAAPTAKGASLSLRGVQKAFGATRVLERLDLHVPAGQFLAIVGRSGCGKSTLLRLIAGLDAPDSGRVALAGEARVMFQEPRLLPWADVRANVEVGLGPERREAEPRRRALAALEAVGLADRAGEWPSVLSGGQKSRVALARALASRPQLLALDEPLGALDALTRITMQRLLERVWREQKFTALLVTHDVAEAVTLADRVIVIDQGAIARDIRVDLPRPRLRGAAEVAALEGRILAELFAGAAP